MRRVLPVALALAALALPAAARAQPPAPEPAAPALVGSPYLLREGSERVRLYLRLNRALARRFDGELRATVVVDGRFSSLQRVSGRRGGRAACYTAAVPAQRTEDGRLFGVALLVEGTPSATLTTVVALRAPRPGDARGAPLRC